MRRLVGGIIGCGFFGSIQMEAWRRMPDVEIRAACDPAPGRAATFGCRAYLDASEMFAHEQLDFVDIATRPESHLDLVMLAAAHRIPVICQKPMAPSWQDAIAMVEASASAG